MPFRPDGSFECDCGCGEFRIHRDERIVAFVDGHGDWIDSGDVIDSFDANNVPYRCCDCDKEYSNIPPSGDDESEWIRKRERDYVNNKDYRCPICGSTDVSWGSLEVMADEVHQSGTCNECASTWTDRYRLERVDIESYPEDMVPIAESGPIPEPNQAFKEQNG